MVIPERQNYIVTHRQGRRGWSRNAGFIPRPRQRQTALVPGAVPRDESHVPDSGRPRWYPGPYREMNLALPTGADRAGTRGRTAR